MIISGITAKPNEIGFLSFSICTPPASSIHTISVVDLTFKIIKLLLASFMPMLKHSFNQYIHKRKEGVRQKSFLSEKKFNTNARSFFYTSKFEVQKI
jgi:hypothetical protein